MRSAIIVFPGSNCDSDLHRAVKETIGGTCYMVWHKDTELPKGLDLVLIPGGFSFGDYLRCGAIAAHSPIMSQITKFARKGGYIIGICNGFQILTESLRAQNKGFFERTKPFVLRMKSKQEQIK